MTTNAIIGEIDRSQDRTDCGGPLKLGRRTFLQLLGAGILVTVADRIEAAESILPADWRRKGIAARLHVGRDGAITVMTGKVEVGQGSRAQITQAAAEELKVSVDRITLIMADTSLVPNDGITAGSWTTPRTVPAVRKAAAAARKVLVDAVSGMWKVKPGDVKVRDGVILHPATKRRMTYGELAGKQDLGEILQNAAPGGVEVTPVKEWQVLGTSVPGPNRRRMVTGGHKFPSDITRPKMLYGKVLRPPAYRATLTAIDLKAAEAIDGVVVVRDGGFVGCAAATLFAAEKAVEALAKKASWKKGPHPSSKELFAYLKAHSQAGGGRRRRSRGRTKGSVKDGLAKADKTVKQTYEIAYVQHAPMEPRAAVAEWTGGGLTVWTGSQAPHRVHSDLVRTFRLNSGKVRVIVPDTGGGFGGKHSSDAAVEAARLAKAAKRPVCLRWSRQEEFTWAYFRPAAVIDVQAGIGANGSLTAWDFTSINPGSSAVDTPYEVPNVRTRSVGSDGPLREGSYRCLAATANNFARESFMDELASAAGADPLAFRLAHLKDGRLKDVLKAAAKRFGWNPKAQRLAGTGVGLACGIEKGSFVAACVEVGVDRRKGEITVRRVCEVFECGAVQNPANLLSQVHGCIIMGMGAALKEEIKFEKGRIINGNFGEYHVPRFTDVPKLDIHLLDRADLPSAGGGETPIIAIAPAIANAVFAAAGVRIRSMPIRGEALRKA